MTDTNATPNVRYYRWLEVNDHDGEKLVKYWVLLEHDAADSAPFHVMVDLDFTTGKYAVIMTDEYGEIGKRGACIGTFDTLESAQNTGRLAMPFDPAYLY